jgi:hypothetical protein
MPLVTFLKAAAGPSFGPYQVGDRANLTNQTITDLGDAVALDTNAPPDVATQPASTE